MHNPLRFTLFLALSCLPLQAQEADSPLRDSTACDVSLVAFTDSKSIAYRVIEGKRASIVRIIVQAVGYGTTWRTVLARPRYTVEVEEGQIT